jgi:hypothetical protein
MSKLAIGDALWHESFNWLEAMKRATNYSRMPAAMRGMRFAAKAYTAVGTEIGDVRVVVRIERQS